MAHTDVHGALCAVQAAAVDWVSALSARLLGITTLGCGCRSRCVRARRWFSVSVGGGTAWIARLGVRRAAAGPDHLWHVLASMCMTDGVLVAFYTAAIYCLFSDPWLESRRAFWGFAVPPQPRFHQEHCRCSAAWRAGALLAGRAGEENRHSRGSVRPRRLRGPGGAVVPVSNGSSPALVLVEHVSIEILGFGGGTPPQTPGRIPPCST